VPYGGGRGIPKGSATEFTEDEYMLTIGKANHMETLVTNHGAIMDMYDPEKRIGLIVDEWGTWYDVEPGTNPGFLYQQSTMRDAMVAALTLNIFNKHADRVHMANIAQLINVLQSVMLTDGAKMIKTPTFHAFKMYKEHQGATLVQSAIDAPKFTFGVEEYTSVSESASVTEDGKVVITLANLDPKNAASISMRVDAMKAAIEKAELLAGEMHAKNDFDDPENVKVEELKIESIDAKDCGTEVAFTLPPVSVAKIVLA